MLQNLSFVAVVIGALRVNSLPASVSSNLCNLTACVYGEAKNLILKGTATLRASESEMKALSKP